MVETKTAFDLVVVVVGVAVVVVVDVFQSSSLAVVLLADAEWPLTE